MEHPIYMDCASTTKPAPEVVKAIQPYLTTEYGNPSSLYEFGFSAKSAVEHAREQCASLINADPENIIFTSGATESDNQALVTLSEYMDKHYNKSGIITSQIEHPAILNTCKYLENHHRIISYLLVDKYGFVNLEQFENTIGGLTGVVSIMLANNECGTIEPIEEIAKIVHDNHAILHVDATQGYGNIPIDVKAMGIDALSSSSHKINGLLGTGLLYLDKSKFSDIEPFIHGGAQERGYRCGTENVIGDVAFGVASELRQKHMQEIIAHNTQLRDYLFTELLKIDGCHINGVNPLDGDNRRLSNNVNVRFDGVDGYRLQALLAESGICVSNASACHSGVKSPSHVLKALGLSDDEANSSLRLTVDSNNTLAECEYVVKMIKYYVSVLRLQ